MVELRIKVIKMSVNELLEQWLFEYACRHCLYTVLNGNNILIWLHCSVIYSTVSTSAHLGRAHNFSPAAEFPAEPQNFPFAAE